MQDVHSISGGGGGRMFGTGGERRMRPHHHQNAAAALKCPRCDSLNTKFCYYNNYNLSQPRHFCKNCRRYWTKGGVLRNVPVGGGCRKTKRSSSKPKTAPSREPNKTTNNSRSSSDTEALSAPSSSSSDPLKEMLNPNPGYTLLDPASDCGLFADIGSLTGLIASGNSEPLGFGLLDQTVLTQQQNGEEEQAVAAGGEIKISEMAGGGGLLDQAVPVQLSALQGRSNGGEFGALDWQDGGDHGLFDLTNTVDQAYWSQTNEWTDQVQNHHHSSLYLP